MNMMLQGVDILVALKLAVRGSDVPTYEGMAEGLGLSASGVHKAVLRAHDARLVNAKERKIYRAALEEFLIHGVKYMLPAEIGRRQRGLATAYSAKPLLEHIAETSEGPVVWHCAEGDTRGESLNPIYTTAPFAASKDPALYELLVCVDGIRVGGVRVREEATRLLRERLKR